MNYATDPSDATVEASLSSSPDDLSEASIRISIAPTNGEVLHDIEYIDISIDDTLTIRPADVTPIVSDPDDWEFGHLGGGTFRAYPKSPLDPKRWVFGLLDIPVVAQVGPGRITIDERRGSRTDPIPLWISKVQPKLRIDHFAVVGDGGATTSSGQSVDLAWATTGATTISLYGPSGRVDLDAAIVDVRDHTRGVTVDSTGTYTLIAERPEHGHAVAQLTVTVADEKHVQDLEVTGPVAGDLTVDGKLHTDRLRADLIAGDLVVDPPSTTARLGVDRIVVRDRLRGGASVGALQTSRLRVQRRVENPDPDVHAVRIFGHVAAGRLLVTDRVTSPVTVSRRVRIGEWTLEQADDGSLTLGWSDGETIVAPMKWSP